MEFVNTSSWEDEVEETEREPATTKRTGSQQGSRQANKDSEEEANEKTGKRPGQVEVGSEGSSSKPGKEQERRPNGEFHNRVFEGKKSRLKGLKDGPGIGKGLKDGRELKGRTD